MVLGLRPFLGAFLIFCLSFHPCRALDNTVLSWVKGFHSSNEMLAPNQLMECETLNISLSPETNNPSRDDTSYHVLAVEPGGKVTMSLVGYEPSSLHWTIQYPAGTQLFVALLDSFGTSLGVLLAAYTVTPGSTDCLTKPESHGVQEATRPKISSSVFDRLLPCGSWEMSFSGGKPPYSVSIVALKSGSVYDYSIPSGEHILSYMNSGELSGQVVVLVSDANGMFGTTSSIINIADTQDTPFADSSDAFSKCRPAYPRNPSFRLREPPRSAVFRFRRGLPDHPHMQLSRNLVTINISHANGIIVAVCASLGGTGIVAMAIYAIMMYRRRQKLLDAQDTLPRPFEVTVPAATTTSISMITHNLTSPPTLGTGIPRRIYSQSGGRCRYEARRKGFSARIKSSRAGSTSASTQTVTAPSQSPPGSSHNSRNIRMQPHLSDASLFSNHAGPSSYRTPPHSWTHPHTATPPDTQPQSSSQPEQSSSSLPTGKQSQRTAGVSAPRSASVQERRSAKRAHWLSRSASELHSTAFFEPRHRVPEYRSHGPHPSSGRYAHRHEGEFHVDALPRPTNHLRHWHSASPVVHVQRVRSDLDSDVGAAIVFQHQDAGVMQELPPPYHKLVRLDADV